MNPDHTPPMDPGPADGIPTVDTAASADMQPNDDCAELTRVVGLADDFYPECIADNGIGGMCGLPDDGHTEHGKYDRLPAGKLVLRPSKPAQVDQVGVHG